MPTNTPRFGLSKPASSDLVSSYPATIGPSFNTIDAEMLRQRGAWSSSTAYAVNDLVTVGGAVYVAIATSTNQTPPNATFWQPFGTTPAQLTAHEGAADPHPNYLTPAEANAAYEPTGTVATHAGAADPHTGYQKESEKDQANGYPGLNASGFVVPARLGSGTPDATTVLHGNGTWAVPAGGGGGAPTDATYITTTANGTLSAEKVLGTDIIMRGVIGSRPAAGIAGRLYQATDGTQILYRDNGSSWDEVALGRNEATLWTVARTSGGTTTVVGTRRRINLIEGTNVTIAGADDGANNEVDITINATGGGSGVRVEDENSTVVAAATGINFAGAGVTVTDAGSNEALVTIPGAASGGGWDYLGGATLASDANTIPAVTIAARDLIQIVFRLVGYTAADIAALRFNGDLGATATNYQARFIQFSNATPTPVLTGVNFNSVAHIPLFSGNTVRTRTATVTLGNRLGSDKNGPIAVGAPTQTAATIPVMEFGTGTYFNTTAQITSVEVITVGGLVNNMLAGTAIAIFGRNVT